MRQEEAFRQFIEALMKAPTFSKRKEPWEWDENYIINMIGNKLRENINLDYKATASLGKSDKRRNEISKDVSAFANSAGGTLVYGVLENELHEPEKIDGGYNPADISGEWLEQVINSNIQPKIQGIRINQIDLPTQSPSRVIYAIYVPQSLTAHQANDKRYYKRYNFESVPMNDWEIKDILNRGTYPDLKVILDIERGEKAVVKFKENEVLSEPITVNVLVRNDGDGVAEYSVINLFVPPEIQLSIPNFEAHGLQGGLNRFSINLAVPAHMPIFRKAGAWKIKTGTLRLPKHFAQTALPFAIPWNVAAPQMEEKSGAVILVVKEGKLNASEFNKQDAATALKKVLEEISLTSKIKGKGD